MGYINYKIHIFSENYKYNDNVQKSQSHPSVDEKFLVEHVPYFDLFIHVDLFSKS